MAEENKTYPRGKHPNSLKNLEANYHHLTKEERDRGRARMHQLMKDRQTFNKVLKDFLSYEIDTETVSEMNEDLAKFMKGHKKMTMNEVVALAQIVNGIKGDNRAFENVRDTIGEKPADKAEHSIFSEGIHVIINDDDFDD